MTLEWLEEEKKPGQPFMLMYLHKAPHRSWLMAERHLDEFTNRSFPEPETLFDTYEGRPAADEAEMNVREHLAWAGDNKVFPEVMDELGLKEIGYDKVRYQYEVGRLDSTQKANFLKAYTPVNEAFKKAYPGMDEKALTQWKYQRYMQDYLGTIKAVDENVGRLLDYLESNNLMENTIIVYTSDQGFYLGEHGWFDKRFAYNESFKTPLLVAWPGKVQAGSKTTTMVQNLDFAQTFLEVAGVDAPADMQGESLVPLLTGKMENWNRDAVYYHYYEYPAEHMVNRHYAIVTEDYKLIHFYYGLDYWELYDRKKDPHEMNNVYGDPAYSEIQEKLHKELIEIRKKYGDSDELSEQYLNTFLDDVERDGIFGVNQEKLNELLEKRKSNE
jgi:arylsulfatase A-like enzyme